MTLKPADVVAFVKKHVPHAHHQSPVPEPLTVMVVDDEEPVRRHVARVFAEVGIVPVLAADGPEALAKLPALGGRLFLVTDLKMPGMGGEDLARLFREQRPELKVLYLTGFADRLFTERGILSDNEAFLEKPFSPNGLLEAVALLVTGHPSVEALKQAAAVAPPTPPPATTK